MEQYIEELKRLFYSDRLTQSGKRKLIEYYEQRIKQLEEENRIYGLEACRVRLKMYIDKNYISKSLVKEKKEELDKEEKRELKGTKGQDRYYIKQKYMYKRKVLEELLREE